ncbi:MAG: DUF5312 family protein [Spirochaetota bacterium]|nr:DUF5312 family protein [Spirochaetota bacterium]
MSNIDLESSSNKGKEDASEGFFKRLLSIILKGSDPEKEKKRLLREIAKTLKKHRLKFYNPKNEEALGGMAKFLYEIYKIISPAQVLLENAESSGALRTIIIDAFMTDEQREVMELLNEDAIRERATQVDPKILASELKDELVGFFAGFTSDKVNSINSLYNLLIVFLNLVDFDYYFSLKKFDSGLPERDFVYNPKFESIKAEYILDDIKDFLAVLPENNNSNWEELFNVLKAYKGTEIIDRTQWKKILKGLDIVRKERIFVLMIQHIDKDPKYNYTPIVNSDKIVDDYLSKMRTQTEIVLQKILKERKSKKVDGLLMEVFGTTAISRMKNYTDKANLMFTKKMLGGFIHVAPANYLKAFLLDFFKRDIKTLMDLLLIRGKWATAISSQHLSEAFHTVMDVSAKLVVFDEELSDEGSKGIALKALTSKSDRDKNSITILRTQLKATNDNVLNMITVAAQNLIIMGKSLKSVLEDKDKKDHEMIINWKEIESATELDLKDEMARVYKKIYQFVQLMQFFVKKK